MTISILLIHLLLIFEREMTRRIPTSVHRTNIGDVNLLFVTGTASKS